MHAKPTKLAQGIVAVLCRDIPGYIPYVNR